MHWSVRDARGAIRLPSPEMILGIHTRTIPNRNHPLLPEHTGDARRWDDIVRDDPCCWCGSPPDARSTVEHVIARAAGGRDGWDNKVGACWRCNNERGSSTILQYLAKRACLDRLLGRGHVPITVIHDLARARSRRR